MGYGVPCGVLQRVESCPVRESRRELQRPRFNLWGCNQHPRSARDSVCSEIPLLRLAGDDGAKAVPESPGGVPRRTGEVRRRKNDRSAWLQIANERRVYTSNWVRARFAHG